MAPPESVREKPDDLGETGYAPRRIDLVDPWRAERHQGGVEAQDQRICHVVASRMCPAAQVAISSMPFARSAGRSEEHTSELQSLMRISYAVFCLKQKKQHQ